MSVRALQAALLAAQAAAPAAAAAPTPPDAAQAPLVLAGLAGDIAGLDEALARSRLQVAGAQASLRLLLPAGVPAEQIGALAVGAEGDGAGSYDVSPAQASDARLYVFFDRMRVALAALLAHNRRFGTVIDLMAAASHLLDASTFALALRLVGAHIGQCHQLLAELDVSLEDCPRLSDAFGQDFRSALN